jgi:hypothetical protein
MTDELLAIPEIVPATAMGYDASTQQSLLKMKGTRYGN